MTNQGGLPQTGLGARGVSWLAATSCTRIRVLGAAGIAPATAAEHLFTLPKPELSTFAAGIGNAFETWLFANNAQHLIETYKQNGLLDSDPDTITDLRLNPDTNTNLTQERATQLEEERSQAREKTRTLLTTIPQGTHLILSPRVWLTVGQKQQEIVPDYLIITNNQITVGEVKSGLNQAGYTTPALPGRAALQAAVGATALQHAHPTLHLTGYVDVCLRHRSRTGAQITRLETTAETTAVEALLQDTATITDRYPQRLDRPGNITALPHHFTLECFNRCALAPICAQNHDHSVYREETLTDLAAHNITPTRAYQLATGQTPTGHETSHAQPLRDAYTAAQPVNQTR